MKEIIKSIAIFLVIAGVYNPQKVYSQSPQKISYQAVIRNNSDQLLVNQGIGMRISILKGSIGADEVYVETHSPVTNGNGLVTLEIGTGTTNDDFSTIDWANGDYFIKTETDPTISGGTNYTITSTSQLLSVPYALHAKTAEKLIGAGSNFDLRVSVEGDSLLFGDNKHVIIPGISEANPPVIADPHKNFMQTYVSTTGNDSDNGSLENPWRTVMHALRQVNPGTVINISQGTYKENFVINLSTCPALAHATPELPVRLVSRIPHDVIFQQPDATPNQRTVSYQLGNCLEFYGIDFRGTQVGQNDAGPLWVQTRNDLNAEGTNYKEFIDDPKLIGCRFSGTGTDAIKFVRVRRALVEGCLFEGNHSESGIDALSTVDLVIRYNTFSSSFMADDYITYKAGSLGNGLIEHNDFNGNMKSGAGACIYMGNATRAISYNHSSTPFIPFECSNVTVQRNYFRGSGTASHGMRMAGAIDCTVQENVFASGFSIAMQLQQSMSAPTEFELTSAEYNALTTAQKTAVYETGGRYFVAHRTQGAIIKDNVRIGTGDFSLGSNINQINHNYWNVSPASPSVIAPSTRGTQITGNLSQESYIPQFTYGHEAPR